MIVGKVPLSDSSMLVHGMTEASAQSWWISSFRSAIKFPGRLRDTARLEAIPIDEFIWVKSTVLNVKLARFVDRWPKLCQHRWNSKNISNAKTGKSQSPWILVNTDNMSGSEHILMDTTVVSSILWLRSVRSSLKLVPGYREVRSVDSVTCNLLWSHIITCKVLRSFSTNNVSHW